jgi:short-subunit dehydrogenase
MTRTALITGASGGLGADFARLAAKDGYNLILVARSKDLLEALKTELTAKHSIDVRVMAEDLSDETAVERLCDVLQKEPIDLLINNAGFGDFGLFQNSAPKRNQGMIRVNIEALTALTHAALPGMITRKTGKILNVASTASFQPGPLLAVYYATKAYVLNFSLALSNETQGTGVTVTCLCPGPTKTGFQSHANMNGSKLFTRHIMESAPVARIGYDACMNGKPLVISGTLNKIFAFSTRFISRMRAAAIAKKVQEAR